MSVTAISFWIVFLVSLGAAAAFTPLSILLAKKTGALDIPKDNRRMHNHPIPRIGGIGIFAGVTVAIILAVQLGFCDTDKIDDPRTKIYGIVISGAALFVIGLIDDYIDMKAWIKLLGQIGVATLVYYFGVRINVIFGNTLLEGVVSYLCTVIWIVGITNTINLVDGLDGLAAGIAAISSLAIAYVAYIFGYYSACMPLLALAGGCFGFIPYNFHPARTFMGDCGSQFLGFMMASMAVLQPVKKTTVVAMLVPALILALPLFDTLFAIIRRLINHKPIMEADKGHVHHRLMQSGMGQRRTVISMYGICGIMSMAAIMWARDLDKETIGLVLIAILFLVVLMSDPNRRSHRPGRRDKPDKRK